MDRRSFLRKAGLGSAALASLPSVFGSAARAAPGTGKGGRHFTVVAVSKIDGTSHRMAFEGTGTFDAAHEMVRGAGSFVHFLDSAETPDPIVGFGTWATRDFVAFTDGFGTYGLIEAGVLKMLADLEPVGGSDVEDLALKLVCNIGPAGITTGQAEGFHLTVPGLGTFMPFAPPLGLTHISTPNA